MNSMKDNPKLLEFKNADLKVQLEKLQQENVQLRNKLEAYSPNNGNDYKKMREKDNTISTLGQVVDSKNSFIKSQKHQMAKVHPMAQSYLDMIEGIIDVDSENLTIKILSKYIKSLNQWAQNELDYIGAKHLPKDYSAAPIEVQSESITPVEPTEISVQAVESRDRNYKIHKNTHGVYEEAFISIDEEEPLEKYLDKDLTIHAIFDRYSTVKIYNGKHVPCVLIRNVKRDDGEFLKDHSWMLCGEKFVDCNFKKGDLFAIDVKVQEYKRKNNTHAIGFVRPKNARRVD